MKLTAARIRGFQRKINDYYRTHKRDFPWRETRDPYAILVSEMMLQQTQAERVIPKYLEWMKKFPTPASLSNAKVSDVLKMWQGLGYNRRALNLRRAAEMIVNECKGEFPKELAEIDALPGVGPYTAGAIAAFAFNVPSVFIETNIRTVYLHFFCKGKTKVRDEEILELVECTLPVKQHSDILQNVGMSDGQGRVREWYNALMDYGAMLKSTIGNPNIHSTSYAKQSKFKGSRRELRGAILKKAALQSSVFVRDITSKNYSVADIFAELVTEGFLKKKGNAFILA
ncbi:MAG: A/G-specific adenine glycosylase [bacterium]|nr:A/G-specific adenine glycosylase [bacterium]